jgi:hypothetical protein
MDIEVTVIMDDGTRTMPVRSRMPLSAFVDTILQNERTETLIARQRLEVQLLERERYVDVLERKVQRLSNGQKSWKPWRRGAHA